MHSACVAYSTYYMRIQYVGSIAGRYALTCLARTLCTYANTHIISQAYMSVISSIRHKITITLLTNEDLKLLLVWRGTLFLSSSKVIPCTMIRLDPTATSASPCFPFQRSFREQGLVRSIIN